MSTDRTTRRRCLDLLAGGAVAGLAGCAGDPGTDASASGATPTGNESEPTETTPTGTVGPPVVRLVPVEDHRETRRTGRVSVSPADLVEWLRTAASSDHTLRTYVSTARDMPRPPLSALRDVRLVDEASDLEGHCDLQVESGTRYRMLVGAEAVDPPADAEPTPVGDLPPDRRDLAVAAIEDGSDGARVYPETARGEWARESFFGGHYSYDGETYRGYEVQQTDAAFFSDQAWYVIAASPARGGDDDATLGLPDLDDRVRAELEGAGLGETVDELRIEDPSEALPEYVSGAAMVVTHLALFRPSVEQP
jgi:hypothetical protein